MNTTTIKSNITARYEEYVRHIAESDTADADPPLDLLYAVEKSIDDFVADVNAIKERIRLQGDIAEYEQVVEARALAEEKRRQIEAERQASNQAFDAKIAEVNAEITKHRTRQSDLKPAIQHFRRTVPTWLRERREQLVKREDKAATARRNLHPPAKPLELNDERQIIHVPVQDKDILGRLKESHERKLASYEQKLSKFHKGTVELDALDAELAAERRAIEKVSLLVNPTVEDLEALLS